MKYCCKYVFVSIITNLILDTIKEETAVREESLVPVELSNEPKQEEQILDEPEQPLVVDVKQPEPAPIEVKESPKEVSEGVIEKVDVEMTDVQLVEKPEKEKILQPVNGDIIKVNIYFS